MRQVRISLTILEARTPDLYAFFSRGKLARAQIKEAICKTVRGEKCELEMPEVGERGCDGTGVLKFSLYFSDEKDGDVVEWLGRMPVVRRVWAVYAVFYACVERAGLKFYGLEGCDGVKPSAEGESREVFNEAGEADAAAEDGISEMVSEEIITEGSVFVEMVPKEVVSEVIEEEDDPLGMVAGWH